MPLTFNMLLNDAKIPLAQVRLLNHKVSSSAKGKTPYELWRDSRADFELYQSHQSFDDRNRLKGRYWASFVGTPNGETLFAGFYRVKHREVLAKDTPKPHADGMDIAGKVDDYSLVREKRFSEFIGRLLIAWGRGRKFIQRADNQNKPIVELRAAFREDGFPGFLLFHVPLSRLEGLPRTWIEPVRANRGIYLLTCPKTHQQYVGAATGPNGFWGRWQDYIANGHGGNKELIKRGRIDYQFSILEVAGTAASSDDIGQMERRWMLKLGSKVIGLNR